MKYRQLGKTGLQVSEISLGTWQVGGKWGSGFDHKLADRILQKAIDEGVNFLDTADVYEAGESEIAVGRAIKNSSKEIFVATKCGRQISPHVSEGYTISALRGYVEDSLRRLGLETIDLIQLHCPPPDIFDRPEIFGLFDQLKTEGKIKNLGVSVEQIAEAQKAIAYDNVATIQIIFNMFRQRPKEAFFKDAAAKDVGIIVRVPLASGLLTGTYSKQTEFTKSDHRFGNRNGDWFDKGETFAGIPFETGLEAVDELKAYFPQSENLARHALRWILDHSDVSCVIPGASRPEQVTQNNLAVEDEALSSDQMNAIDAIYNASIRHHVHHLW